MSAPKGAIPWNKGKHLSEAHKERLSKSHLGKQPWLGKTHTTDAREKMSASRKRFLSSGGKIWNFIEDRSKLAARQIRNDTAYKEWRKSVRDRDNWKCQLADPTCEGKVIAHHIWPWAKFPALRYQVTNGITLCRHHHPRKRDDEMKLAPKLLELVLAK